MSRVYTKLDSAVWFYFLIAVVMPTEQLSHDNQQVNSTSKDPREQSQTTKSIAATNKPNSVQEDSDEDDSWLERYGPWGPWSACRPRSCTQTRSKHCKSGSHCSGVTLKEERPCSKLYQLGRSRKHCNKSSRGHRKHRHKKRKQTFHVVVNKKKKSVQKIGARSGDLLVQGDPDPEDNELSLRGEYKKAYSRWSRWTICTKSCTTQRYRWCKRAAVCGKDVIRETAFCYQEGSQCHVIHKNMMRGGADDNSIYSGNGDSDQGYSIAPVPLNPVVAQGECGVTSTPSRAYSANMVRIIGGRPTQPGRWPWQVAVLNRFKEAFCGGTLIAPQWVLTAAHCVRKRLYVRLGEHDLAEREGTEVEMRVEYAVTHPQYDVDTVDNDVALLRLPARWPTEPPGVACLPRPRQPLPSRRLCTILGWGKRRSSDMFGTDVLQEAQVPIVTNEECRGVYEDYRITGNMFCAGDRRGRMDSCAGDSGGPLLCRDPRGRWTVFGITSFGEGCGKRGKFGIYTRLPNYVRWVHRVMKTYTTV